MTSGRPAPPLLHRAIAFLFGPLLRPLLRRMPVPDPWERLDAKAPIQAFGLGARHDFGWYFEGASAVTVTSLEDVQAWLAGCEYASDPHLFQEADFWQHPRTFEQLRKGDCEDFALWAWRKLVELGHDADLVVGRRVPPSRPGARHAWVVLRRDGAVYVYEPVRGAHETAIQPLDAVRDRYVPEFGVGPDRKRFAFRGCLLALREPRPGARERRADTASRPQRGASAPRA